MTKKRLGKIIFLFVLIVPGSLSAFWAFEIMLELHFIELLNEGTLPKDYPEEELASKFLSLIIESAFALILFRFALNLTYDLFFKPKRISYSRERKITAFQTIFTLKTIVIAIGISFFVQSLNDDRFLWAGFWALFSVGGIVYLVFYRLKNLKDIFDDDHDIIR